MAGEHNGGQEAQEQGQAQGGQGQQQEAPQQGATSGSAGDGGAGAGAGDAGGAGAGAGDAGGTGSGGDVGAASDYAKAIAERDTKIAELTSQVNAAATSAEAAERLSKEIAEVRAQAENDRVEYQLTLAGAKNVKAARALLADHGGDVEKLKAAEPWLFGQGGAPGTGAGSTGLPNAGAAKDSERQLKHFYEVAGVADDKE